MIPGYGTLPLANVLNAQVSDIILSKGWVLKKASISLLHQYICDQIWQNQAFRCINFYIFEDCNSNQKYAISFKFHLPFYENMTK